MWPRPQSNIVNVTYVTKSKIVNVTYVTFRLR